MTTGNWYYEVEFLDGRKIVRKNVTKKIASSRSEEHTSELQSH